MKIHTSLKKFIHKGFRVSLQGSLLNKIKARYPHPLLTFIYTFFQSIRIKKSITALLGPQYSVNHSFIEIDVTYQCFRACTHCNRFLNILPASVELSVDQVKKFVAESKQQNRNWEHILISGGEPALHPHIHEIIQILLEYKIASNPKPEIYFLTSRTAAEITKMLPFLPSEINIIDSQKDIVPYHHSPVTIALSDFPQYKNADFYNACHVPQNCGMGLNAFGYYPCTTSAAIDRIFGFNIGRKTLPPVGYSFEKELRLLCSLCGFFNRTLILNDTVSPQWVEAIKRYKESPPSLSRY